MTTTTHIWLIGGGGHAKVVADAAELGGRSVAGVFDDATQPAVGSLGVERLGSLEDAAQTLLGNEEAQAHLAIGDLAARQRVLSFFNERGIGPERFAAIIHSSAIVSGSVRIGRGVFIGAGALVNPDATIGDHAIVNTSAVVEHDVTLGVNCHIAPGATLCGGVHIGPGTLIGAGAVVVPSVRIGAGVTVGAGAVVLSDLNDSVKVVGCPARPIR